MDAKGLARRGLRLLLSVGVASLLLLISVLAVQGGQHRGVWGSTDFQVLNLSPYTQPITAHFLSPGGEVVYQLTDVLPPGGSAYYQPPEGSLPPGFTGTLYLESPGPVAMDIVHLESGEPNDGNEVFPAVADEHLLNQAYTPVDRCIILRIHNLSASESANLIARFYGLAGNYVAQLGHSIAPQGLVTIWPAMQPEIGVDFLGSAWLLADHPIEVTAASVCGGLGVYAAPPQGNEHLLAPRVAPEIPGMITTTIALQNTSSLSLASGQIVYSSGQVQDFTLSPFGSGVFHSPFTNTVGSAVIVASQPVVATVRSADASARRGTYAYLAFASGEATNAVALPVLFAGYEGWETHDDIWVRNVGMTTATVRIRFVGAWTGQVFWDEALVGPGETWQVTMPSMGAERGAALILADQPIIALAGATMPSTKNTLRDHYIRYRGTNFRFDCDFVSEIDFTWSPSIPQPGQTVTLTATAAAGDEPIAYTWDFGDGAWAEGAVVDHSYTSTGWHTVVLAATNCLGFGQGEAVRNLFVRSEFGVAHLPLVLRRGP